MEVAGTRKRMIIENLAREGVAAPERIIGNPDLLKTSFLHRATQRSMAVGRIAFRDDGNLEGFATGFLIGPQLMLTNNHVFAKQEEVEGCVLQMMYEERIDSLVPAAATFSILNLIDTNKDLDMSLLEIAPVSDENITVSDYGWIPLEGQVGKIGVGWSINIIQHPDARTKEIAMRNNDLLQIVDNMLEYRTDTLRGSSGSPVFNDMWQLVALHSTGLPEINAEGLWKDVNGQFRDPSLLGENEVAWRGNGGFRISEIYSYLKKNFGSHPLVARALSEQPSSTSVVTERVIKNSEPTPVIVSSQSHRFTIPINIEVSVGGITEAGIHANSAPLNVLDEAKGRRPNPVEFSIPRNGYNPEFLGIAVPLPGTQNVDEDVLRLLNTPRKPNQGRSEATELKYFNASILMSASRKMAYFAAANGGTFLRGNTQRGPDSWYYDDRIDRDDQLGNYIYAGNDFDRGHLNRRDDLDWGETQEAGQQSNDDTFFWTNCTPQHMGFNQSSKDGLWGALEEFISTKVGERLPFSIFNGPVLANDDRVSRVDTAIKVPSRFWKVVCVRRLAGAAKPLSVTAFVLDQGQLIGDLTEKFKFDETTAQIHQVSLAKLEQLTQLDFSALKGYEPDRPLGRESLSLIVRPSDIVTE